MLITIPFGLNIFLDFIHIIKSFLIMRKVKIKNRKKDIFDDKISKNQYEFI